MSKRKFNKPIAIDLFAGSGGLMLGLEMAGFHSLLANEIHRDPCSTLRRNFPNTAVVEGSILDFSGDQLLKAAGYTREDLEDIDLVAGGPPCQGFSTAGLKDPADVRNNLVGEFVRIVKELRPKFFLMENVAGLKTMYDGKLFDQLLETFTASGYKFHYKIVKASDYGVPQHRKRLVILGARDGLPPEFPEPTHGFPEEQTSLLSTKLKPYVTCGDALGDLPPINQGEIATEYIAGPNTEYQKYLRSGATKISNHEATKHRQKTSDYYALIPPGGTALHIPKELRNKKQGIQRFPLNGQARTITTEPTDFLHPTLNRIPTIRELARIQSYPDRFEFLGQRTTGNKMRRLGYCSQSQQVGNSVPPLMAKALGEAIMKTLKKSLKKSTKRVESKIPTAENRPFVIPQALSLSGGNESAV